MEKLEWRPVVGFEGLYEISNRGDIRSTWRTVRGSNGRAQTLRSRILSPGLSNRGYLRIGLMNSDKKRRDVLVHRLVAIAFIPTTDTSLFVNHKDGNQTNNHVTNLEWVTNQQNQHHARDTGLHKLSTPVEAVNPSTGQVVRFPSMNVARLAMGLATASRIRNAVKKGLVLFGFQWSKADD